MPEKTKVLIVDDEYSFCKSLKTFLVKHDCDAVMTTNGEQALDMIVDENPAIMTLDIRMPGINGYEVLEKARWKNERTAIIVISAIDVPNMEDSLLRVGASAVMNKPVDLNKLLENIKKFAAGRSPRTA